MYSLKIFNKAHESLAFLINYFDIKKMHVPYYLCDVVRHTIVKSGCKPEFYHVKDDFAPSVEFDRESYVLYPNYFGICDKNVSDLSKIYPNLIVDNAHAFFSAPCGLACFNSAYKFGLGDFSCLQIREEFGSKEKIGLYEEEKKKRIKAFQELDKKYSKTNLLNIDKNSVPFCYPYLAQTEEQADKLVRELKKQGMTVFRYWNPLPESFNEYKFYSRLVPIPIGQ